MSSTLGKVLLLGVPLLLSLSWFTFWVVRLTRTAKKLKKSASGSPNVHSESSAPGGARGE